MSGHVCVRPRNPGRSYALPHAYCEVLRTHHEPCFSHIVACSVAQIESQRRRLLWNGQNTTNYHLHCLPLTPVTRP